MTNKSISYQYEMVRISPPSKFTVIQFRTTCSSKFGHKLIYLAVLITILDACKTLFYEHMEHEGVL